MLLSRTGVIQLEPMMPIHNRGLVLALEELGLAERQRVYEGTFLVMTKRGWTAVEELEA